MWRKAVGAVVVRGKLFMLVERIGCLTKDDKIAPCEPEWDLVKGGVEGKESSEGAIKRELLEETGSTKFKILKKSTEKLNYFYPTKLQVQTGFVGQDMEMFLVEFTGKPEELKGDGEEIGRIEFFNREDAIKRLKYPETRDFFERHAPGMMHKP